MPTPKPSPARGCPASPVGKAPPNDGTARELRPAGATGVAHRAARAAVAAVAPCRADRPLPSRPPDRPGGQRPDAALRARHAATDSASATGPDAPAGRRAGPPPALGRAGAAATAAWRPTAAVTDGSTRADGNNLHYMEFLEVGRRRVVGGAGGGLDRRQSAEAADAGAMLGGPTTCPCALPSGSRR